MKNVNRSEKIPENHEKSLEIIKRSQKIHRNHRRIPTVPWNVTKTHPKTPNSFELLSGLINDNSKTVLMLTTMTISLTDDRQRLGPQRGRLPRRRGSENSHYVFLERAAQLRPGRGQPGIPATSSLRVAHVGHPARHRQAARPWKSHSWPVSDPLGSSVNLCNPKTWLEAEIGSSCFLWRHWPSFFFFVLFLISSLTIRHLDFFDMVRTEDERELARRYDEVKTLPLPVEHRP